MQSRSKRDVDSVEEGVGHSNGLSDGSDKETENLK